MDYEKIVTYGYLKNNKIAHVKIDESFLKEIKNKIIQKYGSLRQFNLQKLKICYETLRHEFNINEYFKLPRLLEIIQDIDISEEELFAHIAVFFARGSNTSKELILNKELEIDEFFVEVYALYLAEGDNGSNGRTIPRKVRFANSELVVHKHFIKWLRTYFPDNYFYFRILIPHHDRDFNEQNIENIKQYLDLEDDQIRTVRCIWKKKTQLLYKTCLDNALLIDFILSIKEKIKELCRKNKKLAAAYIRGMMIGEGTAYFNRSRYVRVEMRNEEEIKYLHELFTLLGYSCKPSLRSNRHNMWSLYIGAKQLKKYHNEIGFGIHKKRQKILERGVNKKLRVNQYC